MRTIYIIGDSTVETGSDPYYGWGGQLEQALPEGFCVQNHAKGGRSSLSFLNENRFAPVESALKPSDILLIQFGHNDEKDDIERHTDSDTTFPEMLTRYIAAAQDKGATPVLITSVARRYFTGDGSLMYTHGEYPRAVRLLAAEKNIPLIDLKKETRALYIRLGPEVSGDLFVKDDKTHYNLHGARTVAAIVAQRLSTLGLL